jgi:hypothetical protein
VKRPDGVGAFQFVILASLRAGQLTRGCVPRITEGNHKLAVIAQMEISEGKVLQSAILPSGEVVPLGTAATVADDAA